MGATQCYELLGVERNATNAEVKEAYRQLALKWHPDKHADTEAAEIKFLEITQAYEFILADSKRQKAAQGDSKRQEPGDPAEEDNSETANESEEETTAEDDGDNYWSDPLAGVPLPRHCCIAGPHRR